MKFSEYVEMTMEVGQKPAVNTQPDESRFRLKYKLYSKRYKKRGKNEPDYEYTEILIHDGDGIRTTVFQGLPIVACAWCHNRKPRVIRSRCCMTQKDVQDAETGELEACPELGDSVGEEGKCSRYAGLCDDAARGFL